MGLFSGLEGNLEKYIEGFFKDKFKCRVQPIEIAKRLAREMRDNRRVSISNIYVPNEYTVSLHPEDWESIGAFNKLLSLELQDYIVQKAEEKGFTPVADPVVTLEKDEGVERGHLKVAVNFSEAVPTNKKDAQKENDHLSEEEQHTQMFHPVKDTSPLTKVKIIKPSLVIEEGQDAGQEFVLADYRTVIGRRDTCDIVLHDPSISRRHAQLDCQGEEYILTDLNSTNGTYVNGLKVTKKLLKSGDVITMGTTVCVFKVS